MTNSPDALRAELRAALDAATESMCEGLRTELTRTTRLEEGRLLQFEVDPWSWDISSCASEELLIEADWLFQRLTDGWFERAGEAEVHWDAMLSEEVCPWFANCWQATGGPARFSPAYLFLHGYHDQQYDLQRRCWMSAATVFGE